MANLSSNNDEVELLLILIDPRLLNQATAGLRALDKGNCVGWPEMFSLTNTTCVFFFFPCMPMSFTVPKTYVRLMGLLDMEQTVDFQTQVQSISTSQWRNLCTVLDLFVIVLYNMYNSTSTCKHNALIMKTTCSTMLETRCTECGAFRIQKFQGFVSVISHVGRVFDQSRISPEFTGDDLGSLPTNHQSITISQSQVLSTIMSHHYSPCLPILLPTRTTVNQFWPVSNQPPSIILNPYHWFTVSCLQLCTPPAPKMTT